MNKGKLKILLDKYYTQFNQPDFIANDPISIPHRFSKKEDIEIIGFLIASIAWGQRSSILKSGERLIQLFDHAPFQFITQHRDSDLKSCRGFVHRTFNDTDLLSFIGFLREVYTQAGGLEKLMAAGIAKQDQTVENGLNAFRKHYESSAFYVKRSAKHIAYPAAGSACKRLNMFLRWMVRKDQAGVDFGIWTSIRPSQLVCPLDVHVINQALQFQLIKSDKSNWKNALALTAELRKWDASDPVKYDFALFGLGVESKKNNLFKL